MQRSHQRIASTFPISKVYQAHIPTFAAGYWLFGFASKKYHPINDMDADAWNALNMRTRYYTSRLHVGAFYLPLSLRKCCGKWRIADAAPQCREFHRLRQQLPHGQYRFVRCAV